MTVTVTAGAEGDVGALFLGVLAAPVCIAANVALAIVVIAWLHNTPIDYKNQPKGVVQIECDPNCASKAADKSGEQSRLTRLIDKTFDDPIALLTAFLLLANGLLTIVAVQQAKQTKILQRAHLSVEPLGIKCRKEDASWFATVGIANSGNLPANSLRWNILIERFSLNDDWKPCQGGNADRKGPVVPPGATVRRSGKRFSVDARYHSLPDQPERFLYVWGEVTYTDGFGVGRFTRFCHRYNSHAIVPTSDGGFEVKSEDGRYHDHGNDAA